MRVEIRKPDEDVRCQQGMEGTSDDDAGLAYLLDLDGWVSEVGGGFWIKACVNRTEPSNAAPHGISYSLTLHKPNGERVIGYDNAHSFVKGVA